MNLSKAFAIFGLMVFLSQAHADENNIYFHIGCYPASSDCIEFQFSSGEGRTVLAKRDPEMTLSQAEITHADLVTPEYRPEQLQLSFGKAAAEKFGQLTRAIVGKELVMVANGKAIYAAPIRQAITGGRMEISSGFEGMNKYLDGVPWLKKMAEDKKTSRKSWNLVSIVSYFFLGSLLIGGSVYFAFLRKRASP